MRFAGKDISDLSDYELIQARQWVEANKAQAEAWYAVLQVGEEEIEAEARKRQRRMVN